MFERELYNVVIVGAGPAGLLSALELAENSNCKVTIIERGDDVDKRTSNIYGIGGAGAQSDGKLNYTFGTGGNLSEYVTETTSEQLLAYTESLFEKFGVNDGYETNLEKEIAIKEFQNRASREGIEFASYKTIHVGTEGLPLIVSNIKNRLVKRDVTIRLNTRANEIVRNGLGYKVITDNGSFESDFLILAPGRSGARWLREQAEKLGMRKTYQPIDIGVRVEVPEKVMGYPVWLSYDAKMRIRKTPTYGDYVRTFCTCPNGFVVPEEYDGYVGVNGHSYKSKKSENTNFALLNQIELTQPLEDPNKYSIDIARLAYDAGGGKPIIQRLGDLEKGRRSTWDKINSNSVKPTLADVTPGDISMTSPSRIMTNLRESLYKLDKIVPGLADDSTLLYFPEFKTYGLRIATDRNLQTTLSGLYVAGDGPGISRGIVGAAISGIIAARGIINNGQS